MSVEISIRASSPLSYGIYDLSFKILAEGSLAYETTNSCEESTSSNFTWTLRLRTGKLYTRTTIALMQKSTGNKIGNSVITPADWGNGSELEVTMQSFVEGCTLHLSVRFTPSQNPLIEEPDVYTIAKEDPTYSISKLLERSKVAMDRCDQGDDMAIAEAATAVRKAKEICPNWHPNYANIYYYFGVVLTMRFQMFGRKEDINDAVKQKEEAIRSVKIAGNFESLGISLRIRFEHFRKPEDIDSAIKAYQDALSCVRTDDLRYSKILDGLGICYYERFMEGGMRPDIDSAVRTLKLAVKSVPSNRPAEQAEYLDSLGISLRLLFTRFGIPGDLDESVKAHREAVRLTRKNNPDRAAYLTNLGNSLRIRFERFPLLYPDDSRDAVEVHQQAVDITPDHPRRLNNLGTSLMTLFEHSHDPDHIKSSIESLRKAVKLSTPGDPDKPRRYSNLGMALGDRFNYSKENRDKGDLDDAIEAHREAVRLVPEVHPDRTQYLNNVASVYMIRYKHYAELNFHDIRCAIQYYEEAATSPSGRPLLRLRCARNWAINTKVIGFKAEILRAFRCAFEILPQAVWIGTPVTSRHSILSEIDGLGRSAAAYAISIGEPALALEWLEAGRSVVWDQFLNLRTPFESLRAEHPDIAKHLADISEELANASPKAENLARIELESHFRKLAEEREQLIEQIRSLPGFGEFQKPPDSSELFGAAARGPVAIINMDELRCDALVILPDKQLKVIPLPKLSIAKARSLRVYMKRTTGGRSQRDTESETTSEPSEADDEASDKQSIHESSDDQNTRGIGDVKKLGLSRALLQLWSDIARPVLEDLDIKLPPSSSPPSTRIWWCPTGPLSSLPLHAAGKYDKAAYGECLSDYVISSYTPTVSELVNAYKNLTPRPFKLLAVAQPNTPGQKPLPQTTVEVSILRNCISANKFASREGAQATKDQILTDLNECSWAHFACHGVQDRAKPTESGLVLDDGRLELAEMIRHSFPSAELAFLSACQTATGDEYLSDEAVHLAAGMQLAGFKGVVATMWSIDDHDGPFVTERFYKKLLEKGDPDSTGAALALQLAVKELRLSNSKMPLGRWTPFIHVGL